jgi:hypothetical protein
MYGLDVTKLICVWHAGTQAYLTLCLVLVQGNLNMADVLYCEALRGRGTQNTEGQELTNFVLLKFQL